MSRLAGVGAANTARLVARRARRGARGTLDRLGGTRLLAGRGRAYARDWAERSGEEPMRGWLDRPDAGRSWIPLAGAAAWARSTCTAADMHIANEATVGRYELLGSGPVALGRPPGWRTDLYTGREWPLSPSAGYTIARGDGSDIKTVWDLSRHLHFLPLARAHARTGRDIYRDVFVGDAMSWIEQNPLGCGPHWASPMDVAIRCANWCLAAVLFARTGIDCRAGGGAGAGRFWERYVANLYASGLFLERHLEWHPVWRGNHYVSNGVGLVYLGALFKCTRAGDRWLRKGADILTHEIDYQVGDDGAALEGSIGYHRLDTELFAWGGEVLRLNLPDLDLSGYDARLRAMYGFIRDYLPVTGEAPMIGDADDGRLHLIDARGQKDPRRHALGLPERHWPEREATSRSYPDGGFHVLRRGDDHAVIRCGPVGLRGAGSHDHNDQLSFELVIGGRRVVADSGSFVYTRDLEARHRFRSVEAHNVVQLGGEEPNPIAVGRPWRVLADRTRAEGGLTDDVERPTFVGTHHGYAHRPSIARVRRRLSFDPVARAWRLEDGVTGVGEEELVWRLHLAPGAAALEDAGDGAWILRLDGDPAVEIRIEAPAGLDATIRQGPCSDRYNHAAARPVVDLSGRVTLPVRIAAAFRQLGVSAPLDLEPALTGQDGKC